MITRAALLAAALRLLGYYNGNDYSTDNPGGMSGVGGMATNWEPCIQDIGTVASGVGEVAGTIAAAQSTIALTWDAATAAADPGAGKLRAATATPAVGSYSLLVSATDSAGAGIGAMLTELGASSSATKARARLVAIGDAAKYLDLLVTGVSGAGAYRTLAVTCIGGPGGFAAGDAVALGWVRTGDKGDTGAAGSANVAANTDGVAGISLVNASTGTAAAARVTLGNGADTQDGYLQLNGQNNTSHGGARSLNILANAGDICLLIGRLAPSLVARFKATAGSRHLLFSADNTAPWIGTSAGALNLTSATGQVLVNGVAIGSGEDTATSIAAASTVDIGSTTAKAIKITAGTGPITSWGTAAAGVHRDITFAVPVTLTYNATSAILTGGGDINTMAGDTCRMESLGGGNWKMLSYQRANGNVLGTATAQALSTSDKSSNATLSNSNRTVTTSDGGVASGRAAVYVSTPIYWEVVVNTVGSSNAGVAGALAPTNDYLTGSVYGWGYLSNGNKATNGGASAFGSAWSAGDRLCFAYNPTTRGLWMGKIVGGVAVWGGSGDPAAGASPAYTIPAGTAVFPSYSVAGSGASLTFCFSAGQQVAAAPTGFTAFN